MMFIRDRSTRRRKNLRGQTRIDRWNQNVVGSEKIRIGHRPTISNGLIDQAQSRWTGRIDSIAIDVNLISFVRNSRVNSREKNGVQRWGCCNQRRHIGTVDVDRIS